MIRWKTRNCAVLITLITALPISGCAFTKLDQSKDQAEDGEHVNHPQCGFESNIPECTKCANDYCCLESRTCFESSQCSELYFCLGNCNDFDDFCGDNCLEQQPNGINPLMDFINCLDTTCSWECEL